MRARSRQTCSIFRLDQDLNPREASRGTICCKRTVTFKRPPGESWEQRDGLLGESFLFATRGIDAIYNNSCCPQLGMKTISICPGPWGNCRTRDVLYVSAQCPLLQRECGRVGREELRRAQLGLTRGWGEADGTKGDWVLHVSVCYLRSYRWFLFSCGFQKPPCLLCWRPFPARAKPGAPRRGKRAQRSLKTESALCRRAGNWNSIRVGSHTFVCSY